MFLVRLRKDGAVLQELLGPGEEASIFIICMGLQEFVPSQTVPDKSGFVSFRNVLCLVKDGIIPAKEGVVYHTHMARTACEHVALA